MEAPKAPRDAENKRQGFFIMRGKQVAGAAQPDGTGIAYLYLDSERLVSSAQIAGNVQNEEMLDMLRTTKGFRRLVHSIGVCMEAEDMKQQAEFVLQMYGKSDLYGSGTVLRMMVEADGRERILKLSDCAWSEDDLCPGQIRFVFERPEETAEVSVKLYLQDGFTAPEPEEEQEAELSSALYREMLKKSLLYTGNNARLKKALEKAKRGEDMTIAFIGGSITQGAGAVPINTECYAYKTFAGLCRMLQKSTEENIHYRKAGVGGTPSELGMLRYERDVLREGEVLPDIVVVEFAVNDAGDETNGECYDSLVRKILSAPNRPAVILLFAVFANDWNLQERLSVVGKAYRLPMVSTRDCVVEQFYRKAGEGRVVSKQQFFYDAFHPTNIGHTIMADGLLHLFETVDAATADEEEDGSGIAAPIGDAFWRVKLFDRKEETLPQNILQVSCGDFSETDEELQAVEMDTDLVPTKEFPYNWMHKKGSAPFVMDIRCSSLLLIFKDSGSPKTGRADVYADGEKVLTADPSVNGWLHCNAAICFRGKEDKVHHVEIRMQEEDKEFTILGFGYVE